MTLNKDKIAGLLNSRYHISLLEEVGSTNDYLKALEPLDSPQICIANKQLSGRGRLGRVWESPTGANIYLSIAQRFKGLKELSALSLVTGLALHSAVEKILTEDSANLFIKWPNDLIYNSQKLGGILIETEFYSDSVRVIIGIGLNVNMIDQVTQITNSWTSLRKITGRDHDRNHMIADIINTLSLYYDKFEKDSFSAFAEEWHKKDFLSGKDICIIQGVEKAEGKYLGVDNSGMLRLKSKDGTVKQFPYGEASVIFI